MHAYNNLQQNKVRKVINGTTTSTDFIKLGQMLVPTYNDYLDLREERSGAISYIKDKKMKDLNMVGDSGKGQNIKVLKMTIIKY